MWKSSFITWALVGITLAAPATNIKTTVSPDGSCGGTQGYTCTGYSSGSCCSQWGWCGSTSDYCGANCQSAFGSCTSSQPTSAKPPASSTKPSSTPAPGLKTSPDATCGGSTGYTCLNSGFGDCCSVNGWCGSTSDYCGIGCQSKFGSCSGSASSSSAKPSSVQPSASASASAKPSNAATLADCLGQKNVPVKFASDSDWNTYAATYNTRLQYTPSVIVLPTTQQHISDSVQCAGQFKVKVQAKSGGHSYASFSTGGMNGIMMVDLENLQNISVDSNGIATVGGGVRLGNMATAIYNQAGRALPHGTCPGVGIGGHATHGGYGYSSRAWGLAMDTIVGLDVVLANGTFIRATSTQYSDVFWALRGAADSFGIVVNFYLQTNPAPTSVINFSYSLPGMISNVQNTVNAMLHIQTFAMNASVVDKNIGFGIYMDGDNSFSIGGTYFGNLNTFNTKIAPELLRTLPKPSSSSVKQYAWLDSLIALGGEGSLSTPTHGYSSHDNFFAKSVTVPEASPLTSAGLTSYFTYIKNKSASAGVSWFSIANVYGGAGSQINTKDTNFAAYSDRNSLWVFQHYGFVDPSSTFPSGGLTFVNGLNTALTTNQPSTGAYLNYVDPSLTAQQAHDVYYGSALYSKLKTLKTQLDPNNVFSNPQSI